MRSKPHWIGLADRVPGHPQDTGRWDTPESRGSFQQISICFLERTLAGMPTTLAVTTSQQKRSFSHPTNTDQAPGQTQLCSSPGQADGSVSAPLQPWEHRAWLAGGVWAVHTRPGEVPGGKCSVPLRSGQQPPLLSCSWLLGPEEPGVAWGVQLCLQPQLTRVGCCQHGRATPRTSLLCPSFPSGL